MMTHQEMIDVITHHMNGGKVESLVKHNPSDEWGIVSTPIWNFSECYYRAKPEPLVLWAVWCVNTRGFWEHSNTLAGAESLRKRYSEENTAKTFTIKKFIEEI